MSGEAAAGGKTILKEFAEKVLVVREGDHAVANVTGRKDAIVAAETAGTSAVVSDSDDSHEIADRPAGALFLRRRDIFLQAAEYGGESGAAAKRNNADGPGMRVRTNFHVEKEKLGARTIALRVEEFREARVLLQESEVFIVASVVPIFRAQLDCDFEILHG